MDDQIAHAKPGELLTGDLANRVMAEVKHRAGSAEGVDLSDSAVAERCQRVIAEVSRLNLSHGLVDTRTAQDQHRKPIAASDVIGDICTVHSSQGVGACQRLGVTT
ncbi:MAG: hypothetical protein ABI899_05070, partial [Actinomycetota bacterium]